MALTSILEVTPLQENWDASVQSLINTLKALLRTLKMTITTQGSHTTPSVVKIELNDAEGTALNEKLVVRVRKTGTGLTFGSSSCVLSAGTDTTLEETISSGQDLVFSGPGYVNIVCTDTVAETFVIHSCEPPVGSGFFAYDNSIQVVHA